MIRKLTDPLRDGMVDEVEEEVNVGAPEDTVKDKRQIRYGPAFEAVPAAGAHPRAFRHPLQKRRYEVGDPIDFGSGCFPFCRVQWRRRNGRQMMVEWSQPELREADVGVAVTAIPTSTSTDASTTQTTTAASTTATSTDASMTQMPPTTTLASTTTATTTTTSTSTLLEQLVQIVLASSENTSSAATQLIQQLQQQVSPTTEATATTEKPNDNGSILEQLVQVVLTSPDNTASAVTQLIQQLQQQFAPTTEATLTTEKPNNSGTILEQLVQVVLTSPENTASAVTQLIQQLQQQFAPTNPAPSTATEATSTTDKPNNVGAIIESIASLGLGVENVRIISNRAASSIRRVQRKCFSDIAWRNASILAIFPFDKTSIEYISAQGPGNIYSKTFKQPP